jgi:thiol:disulfide interchange protein
MKKVIIIGLLFLQNFVFSQIQNPVKWTAKVEKISETEYYLIASGKIEKDWHVYSQFTPDGGPLAMTLAFENQNKGFQLQGKAKESAYKKKFNDVFEVDEYYFENSFTITQKVKITNNLISKIKLNIDYQVCKEVCINNQETLTFEIPAIAKKQDTIEKTTVLTPETVEKPTQTIAKSIPIENKTENKATDKSFWSIFFLAFLGGLTALFTPCVFPMIPMTVSFFLKQSKTKAKGIQNALLYGFSIIGIYVFLGLVVTLVFGAEALNALATNPWFNIVFFILLVVFACSFLGAFEIVLPNSWANFADKQADKGGVFGILFMALALAIVSFSCTGAIVGPLLVDAAARGGLAPLIGMLGFSSALAFPFMFFALFPSWLNALPKSGGWLNTVKVSLGFLELALALKFLSNADLVLQAHWLEREAFIAFWIAIFGAWALYLFGKINLPHDVPSTNISVTRFFIGLVVLSFTIYLLPGLFGAPLKLISAFPPPQTYSESPNGFFGSTNQENGILPAGAKFGEHGIITFTDYQTGLAYAKKVNKPVLLDFTGYACVNCRKMEANVWSDKNVLPILKNEVVLISLYLDDKRPLPETEQYISKTTGRKVVSIGNKWTDFIIEKYKTNSQPYYVLINLKEQNLNPAISYTPDVAIYLKWLQTGILKFKNEIE